MILTGSVSPPGNHSVRIVASTGGESTVPYYITDEAMSNGESLSKLDANYSVYQYVTRWIKFIDSKSRAFGLCFLQ